MRLDRPLTLLICLLIMAAAWLAALAQGGARAPLISAAGITVMCGVIALLRSPIKRALPEIPRRAPRRDESAEFRRALFDLCAALKLGVRYCEDHLEAEPEVLIEQLEQMADNINAFVERTVRPIKFYARAPWPWRYARVLWPWRVNPQGRRPR